MVGGRRRYIPDRAAKIARIRKAGNDLAAIIATGVVGLGFAAYLYYDSYYSAGWHTHAEGTYYIYKDTGERATGYQIIDNTCYLFDVNGIVMEPGWQTFRGDTYYLGKDGTIQRGIIKIDGEEYYFSTESGIFRTGLCNISGDEYYFDDHGFPGSGIVGNAIFDENGKQQTGWVNIGGVQYYFLSDTGEMAVGFLEIEGDDGEDHIYYFDDEGRMATDWQVIDGRKYLFSDTGVLHKGWTEYGGKYYYADPETGACAQGFTVIDGNTYYFDDNGEMLKNWQKIKDSEYHFDDDGIMTVGWYEENTHKYYFDKQGRAAESFTKIGDDYYYFDSKYRLLTGWQSLNGSNYYFGRGGVVASGWTQLEELVYYFDPQSHEAAYGWETIGEGAKEQGKTFIGEVKQLRRYEALSEEQLAELTGEEQEEFDRLSEKFRGDSMEWFQKSVYDTMGAEVMGNYYFYSDNTRASGWLKVAGYNFYFDEETGLKLTGWQTIDGKRYYFGETGAACVGEFVVDDDTTYAFNPDGSLSDGIVKLEGAVRCKLGAGDWLTESFHTEDEKTYYFDEDGYAVTGWQTVNEKLYYFDEKCVMKTGLFTDAGDTYYLTPKGAETEKWVNTEAGATYYFG
ncbi:MAG: cell wall-binding protein, partial [Ruminococcus sp.]|nr:cell wall-binding protein [Ruminococcus sp.]